MYLGLFILVVIYLSSGGSRISQREASTPKIRPKTYYFERFLLKTAWKWKKLDPWGHTSLAPLRSANAVWGSRIKVVLWDQKNIGKMMKTQGNHWEFCLDRSVATLMRPIQTSQSLISDYFFLLSNKINNINSTNFKQERFRDGNLDQMVKKTNCTKEKKIYLW